MNPEIKAKIKARLAIRDANQIVKSNRRILVSTASGPLTEEEKEIKRKGGYAALLQHRAEKGAPAIFERIQRGENICLRSQHDKVAVAALQNKNAAAVATLQAENAAKAAKTITAQNAGLLITQADFDEMQASDRAEFTALGGKVIA